MPSQRVTLRKKAIFLGHLAKTGNVTKAAEATGWARRVAYRHRENDPTFAEAWEDAEQQYADLLEREADRRAVEGVDEPRFYEGGVCGHVRKYSDTLLIFRLKALRPDKYRERQEISGNPESPLRLLLERIDGKSVPQPG
jgi:hypothetical protein